MLEKAKKFKIPATPDLRTLLRRRSHALNEIQCCQCQMLRQVCLDHHHSVPH